MAIVYDVCPTRSESANYNKGSQKDSLKVSWNIDYHVTVSDDANPNPDLTVIGAIDVAAAPGIPVVNRSVYYRNGKVIPWLVCRDKTVSRDSGSLSKWTVRCRFDTGTADDTTEADNAPQPPPTALTDIVPRVESSLSEVERVLYEDKSETPKPCKTPTGNLYDQPFIERLPTLELRISQYESFISYEDMLARKYKVNETTYRSKVRYSWLITNVEATEVEVQLAGGPTTAALVTYTLEYTTLPYGWKDERALVDTHYLDQADGDRKKAFRDGELNTYDVQNVLVTGYPKGAGVPNYDQWETYDTIDFGTFMQA